MNVLRLELKKADIKPYCFTAIAISACLLGLSYIFAWVPHLESGDKNAAVLFSSYQGISAISNAIALMAFSALASAMGFRYVIKEYCGANAILLFSYPVNRKTVFWAKVKLLLLFISITFLISVVGIFTVFAITGKIFSLVDSSLTLVDFAVVYRNSIVLTFLANGIALCSIRIGFMKKSNSITVISAILCSMLLANIVATINTNFITVLLFSAVTFLAGIILAFNLAGKIDTMEI